IEEAGLAEFLMQIQDELIGRVYVPRPARKKEIPKDGGKKVRVLSIPSIVTAWCKGRSSSFWSRSSRRISNRGRMATAPSGQRRRRWIGWPERLSAARHASLTWI